MTWTKIDAGLPDNPNLLKLPRGIRWMHLEFMVWCNQHGTDGQIPRHVLGKVTDEPDPAAAAGALVDAGLWAAETDGWSITDFLEDQPSAADVERTQVFARERQRRQRQHRNGDHSLCDPRYCRASESRVTDAVTGSVTDGVSHNPRTEPNRAGGTKVRARAARPRSATPRGSRPQKVKTLAAMSAEESSALVRELMKVQPAFESPSVAAGVLADLRTSSPDMTGPEVLDAMRPKS